MMKVTDHKWLVLAVVGAGLVFTGCATRREVVYVPAYANQPAGVLAPAAPDATVPPPTADAPSRQYRGGDSVPATARSRSSYHFPGSGICVDSRLLGLGWPVGLGAGMLGASARAGAYLGGGTLGAASRGKLEPPPGPLALKTPAK